MRVSLSKGTKRFHFKITLLFKIYPYQNKNFIKVSQEIQNSLIDRLFNGLSFQSLTTSCNNDMKIYGYQIIFILPQNHNLKERN